MFTSNETIFYGLIALNVAASIAAWQLPNLMDKWLFEVNKILGQNQYYRLISSGFIHADAAHLAFNMFTLFFFAPVVVQTFGSVWFLIIYALSLVGGNLLVLYFKRNDPYYSALGASGAVNGILFASICIDPFMGIYLMFIPIAIPAWLFAIAYTLYSMYGMKKQQDNIGHEAHLGGAMVGSIAAVWLYPQAFRDNKWVLMAIFGLFIAFFIYEFIKNNKTTK